MPLASSALDVPVSKPLDPPFSPKENFFSLFILPAD